MSINRTILAFLLALQDLSTDLNTTETKNLQEVGRQLRYQPLHWQKYTEPLLLQTIQANNELHRSFQLYQDRLDKLETIPSEIIPTYQQIKDLLTENSGLNIKGAPDSLPQDSNKQINNAMLVVSYSDNPKKVVKKMDFLGILKKFLPQSNQ